MTNWMLTKFDSSENGFDYVFSIKFKFSGWTILMYDALTSWNLNVILIFLSLGSRYTYGRLTDSSLLQNSIKNSTKNPL